MEKKKLQIAETRPEAFPLERRDFFKLLGGGIFIFFYPGEMTRLMAEPPQRRSLSSDYNAFLHIREDGKVDCYTGKIEMGQGPITSLAQELADELDVAYEDVKMVMGDTLLCPYDQGTWGSLTTRQFGPYLRVAAAEARGVLLEMASEKLGLPVEQLIVSRGVISSRRRPSKRIRYAELTGGARIIEKHLEVKPEVKDHTEFRVMGKSFHHQDAWEKVSGAAHYTADIRLPGMVYARILRPPSHGATLVSADTSAAEQVPGIQVVRDGDFIAVLHEMPDRVDEAIVKVRAEYSFDEKEVDDRTIFDYLLQAEADTQVVAENGDLKKGKAVSEVVVESQYTDNYVAHAPIEPHTALAQVEGDGITIWASTQSPFGLQDLVARALEYPLDKVRVITPFVGGGFGGKSANGQGLEAARLAKMTGKPIMVAWTRQEEFFFDTFRPAAVVKITSGIDKQGNLQLWDFTQYFAGSRGSDTIYDVPHMRTSSVGRGWSAPSVHPFATGAWRAPGNNTNTFARESQVNIMAHRAGIDPLEFRLKNLKDEKMIAVLKAVADLFGYTPATTPSGRGIGIACGTDAGTWVAHMAEVKVDRETGHVQVLRVACAQDMGMCVNPQGATIQMEGCITMGMGYALAEDIRFTGGKIHTRNFDTYEIPKFSWVPEIKTRILDRMDQPEQGGGEPAIICMGAVIANAIFDATGARVCHMPMSPEKVLEAIRNK